MRGRVAVAIMVVSLVLGVPVRAASLHPRLLKAAPAADSRSAEATKEVALTFNEPLDLALTRVTVLRGTSAVALQPLRLAPADDKTVLATATAPFPVGRYVVRWQVTGDDGHPVKGEYRFEIIAASGR
ncbi:MAG: copper resistance protein CopC [Gemmatimonadaceae bacterium]|nr:copper resistance protein CopC [Gemmatimonadaceae bacterium]